MSCGVKELEVREDMSRSSHRNKVVKVTSTNETKREAGIINFAVNL